MFDICKESGAYLRNSLAGHFFDENLAEAIVDLQSKYKNKTAYDLGCGHGEYTRYLKNKQINCSGFDGNPYTNNITNGLCSVLKLNEPINLPRVDCVICLEVGEHVPKQFEDVVINNIVNTTNNLIILSWAIEGQLGEGHVNCRNNDYIKNKISNFGFKNLIEEENLLREKSKLSWFKNTIMVFKKL